MYVLLIRLRGGVRIVTIERESSDLIDADRPERSKGLPSVPSVHLDGRPVWLVFTTEYCAVCPKIVAEIRSRRSEDSIVVLDVADHLDLASAYKVRRAPTVIRAEADGSVIVRLAGADAVRAELDALALETVTAA
jgi:thiol-disulfide isomerase/thioredoxin